MTQYTPRRGPADPAAGATAGRSGSGGDGRISRRSGRAARRRRDPVRKPRPELAEHERDKLRRAGADPGQVAHRTIACVSGFLIEPAAGRVRLISPEPCSDRWPDGYVASRPEGVN